LHESIAVFVICGIGCALGETVHKRDEECVTGLVVEQSEYLSGINSLKSDQFPNVVPSDSNHQNMGNNLINKSKSFVWNRSVMTANSVSLSFSPDALIIWSSSLSSGSRSLGIVAFAVHLIASESDWWNTISICFMRR
jgi:hypothetical protein